MEVFLTWQMFNGPEGGMSPKDAWELPAVLRVDFQTMLGAIADERRLRKHLAAKDGPPATNPKKIRRPGSK